MATLTAQQVPLITLPNWVSAAAACGFSIESVFDELGIALDLLHVESATASRVDMERVMTACVARSKRRHFPLVLGETFSFEYLPELGTFLKTSPSLRESARVFEWLRALINPHLALQLHEAGAVASLRLDWVDAQSPQTFRWFVESALVSVVKFVRALLGRHGDFRRLTFQHPRPPYADQIADVFRLPVAYAQTHSALEMDRRLLDLRLEGAFESLHRQAEQRVARRLSERAVPVSLATRAAHAIERNPALLGRGIAAVAAELGLHPRTLQRRLRGEGLAFGALQAQVQLRLARQWLGDSSLEIETVSERLGFADRRSFTRAFQRWCGQTPSEFRRQQ